MVLVLEKMLEVGQEVVVVVVVVVVEVVALEVEMAKSVAVECR